MVIFGLGNQSVLGLIPSILRIRLYTRGNGKIPLAIYLARQMMLYGKKNWKLEVPPKVRVFWWRVLHEFLPTKQILFRRHIEPMAFCEVCGEPEESIRHVLLDCTVARQFWAYTRWATGVKVPSLNAETWAADLMSELCLRRDRALIMIGMWAL
jgi:hypothetical protein